MCARITWFGLSMALTFTAPAYADFANGDFEAGGAAWEVSAPAGWTVEFPTEGGQPGGYASLASPDTPSPGEACILQVFECGVEGAGTCTITIDFKTRGIIRGRAISRGEHAVSRETYVRVHLDGELIHSQPVGRGGAWHSLEFQVPCGFHEIAFCLETDDENTGTAGFDNALAVCDDSTPLRLQSWGRLKARFR